MTRFIFLPSLLVFLAAAAWAHAQDPAATDAAGVEFFEKRIRPVLVEHCYQCHSALAKEVKGNLLVDTRESLQRGGESGPAVVPGSSDQSLILAALRHEGLEMPPDRKLPANIIEDFQRWIDMGAPDPRAEPATPDARYQAAHQDQFQQLQQWWSLQPVTEPPIPDVQHRNQNQNQNQNWSAQPIDQFILAQLEQNALQPAPRADRQTLARRLSFALTGLPPDPDQLQQFLSDPSPAAWSRYVDQLLESPHFGERWARHWMDVVRYSDTYGYEWDIPAKGAWRYRDYLIRAFNSDVPFDQLVREHIAGDLLEHPRLNNVEYINESLIGTMFFQMGEKRHGDSAEFDGIHQEMLDNKIDAFSKTFQAQTISCARCHDHKLDPILQSEYYALGGVFISSRWVTNTLDTRQRNADTRQKLQTLKDELRNELAALWRDELAQLPDVLLQSFAGTATAAAAPAWLEVLKVDAAAPSPEDLRYPWYRAVRAAQQHTDVAVEWHLLASEYNQLHRQRVASNRADFRLVADLGTDIPAGWSSDGAGLQDKVAGGDFTVALEGASAINGLLPGGLFTHALSPRLNGAVRSPYLNQFPQAFLTFEYCGGDFSAHRTVVDNAFLTERQVYLNQPRMGLVRLSTFPSMRDRHVYVEFATKTSNPNFPPRVGLGGACSEQQAADPRSWFGVTRVWSHDKDAAPADELARFLPLFSGHAPTAIADVAQRYASCFQESIARWSRGSATAEDVQIINWLLDHGQLTNHAETPARPRILELVRSYRELEQRLELPATVNGMRDADPGYDLRLNVRGEYDQPADYVPRGYARALAPGAAALSCAGSGRRELAELTASPHNPLTARVFVNRVWHWLFGAGIVPTPNDFGHAGGRPSHPELLDYLAARFMAEGWSVKTLVKQIVLTETWQQSSHASAASLIADPENRWLHHFPMRRLEAEAIRDAMLFVSGRLDPKLFGPPIDPHRINEDPQKRLFSGPLDGNGRRSIYTKLTIMEPPRFLALFNQPPPKISIGARDVTNTPAQSLALLNDPFVLQQAEYWAARLVQQPHESVAQRIEFMFQAALSRAPLEAELGRWESAVQELAALHQVGSAEILSSTIIWTDVAHAMFNTKEFLYLQ